MHQPMRATASPWAGVAVQHGCSYRHSISCRTYPGSRYQPIDPGIPLNGPTTTQAGYPAAIEAAGLRNDLLAFDGAAVGLRGHHRNCASDRFLKHLNWISRREGDQQGAKRLEIASISRFCEIVIDRLVASALPP